MEGFSSFFKTFHRKGMTKSFFRIYAPKSKNSPQFNQKANAEEGCDELNRKIKKERSAYTSIPDLKLDERRPLYIPLATHCLEDYGNWTVEVAEIPIDDPDKILTVQHLFDNEFIVLYIHGFYESANDWSARAILDAYLRRGDHSVILFDWSAIAKTNSYLVTMYKLPMLAQITAKTLDTIFNNKAVNSLNLDRIHLVTHSMGCHLGSLIAKNISTMKFKRLTALDPTGVGYTFLKPESRLSKQDAEFVDVIHTDGGKLGYPESCGHVDFYPNGGKRFQPGCPTYYSLRVMHPIVMLSHQRSWQYYAESVSSNPSAFLSCKAGSWASFKEGRIDASQSIAMGYYASDKGSGDYYLQTNPSSPYARGEDGLKYWPD